MVSCWDFLLTPAYADPVQSGANTASQSGNFSFIIMLLVIFAFIYFATWRPQSKRAREQQNLLNSLTKGDEVMTAGGLVGKINKINDQYVALAIANNTEILLQKSAVVSVLPKGTIKSIAQPNG